MATLLKQHPASGSPGIEARGTRSDKDADPNDPQLDDDANHGILELRNRPSGAPVAFPAKDIVDAGFLELIRYGVRRPGDPLLEDSLRVAVGSRTCRFSGTTNRAERGP